MRIFEYCKTTLTAAQKDAYQRILYGVTAKQTTVDCGPVDGNDALKAWEAVEDDHPELFYIGHTASARTRNGFSLTYGMTPMTEIILSFPYDLATISTCEKQLAQVREQIRRLAQSCTTDQEKVLMVAEYIVRNTEYRIDHVFNQNAASSLCYGIAQCSGYSKAVKYLLDYLDVPCIYVTGDADDGRGGSGPHAWNIVQLEGKYYHLDVTFMDGANPDERGKLRQIYLFYDDANIAKDHRWDRGKYPSCDDATLAQRSHTSDRLWVPAEDFLRKMFSSVTSGGAVDTPTPGYGSPTKPKATPSPKPFHTPKPTPTPSPSPTPSKAPSGLFGHKGYTPPSAPTPPVSPGAVPTYKSIFYLEEALRKAVRSRTRQVVFSLEMKTPPTRTLEDVANDGCRNALRKEEVAGTFILKPKKTDVFEVVFKY